MLPRHLRGVLNWSPIISERRQSGPLQRYQLNGDQLRTPLKFLGIILSWCTKGFRVPLIVPPWCWEQLNGPKWACSFLPGVFFAPKNNSCRCQQKPVPRFLVRHFLVLLGSARCSGFFFAFKSITCYIIKVIICNDLYRYIFMYIYFSTVFIGYTMASLSTFCVFRFLLQIFFSSQLFTYSKFICATDSL